MPRIAALTIALVLSSCDGSLGGDRPDGAPGSDAPRTPTDAPPRRDGDAPPDAPAFPTDSGRDPSIDAGPCGATLAASISATPIPGVPSGALAYPSASGGVALAWHDGSAISIQRADGAGALAGPAISIAADGLWGLAASPSSVGALLSRGDELVLAIRALDGAAIAETRLYGAVPHDVTNNEWFGTLLRAARLDFDGARWFTYSTVQRLWPDGIAHYGDTLRSYALEGGDESTIWGWGCSHALEVRLTHGTGGIAPVCSSDCYPGKGVFFMHRTELFLDPSGDCMGFARQRLGGIAAVAGGSLVGFTSAEGRSSVDPAIVRIGDDRVRGAVQWLSSEAGDERELHIGPLGAGGVALWLEGSQGRIARLDPTSGAAVGAAEAIDAALIENASDVFRLSDGDTAWVVSGRLVRLRACP